MSLQRLHGHGREWEAPSAAIGLRVAQDEPAAEILLEGPSNIEHTVLQIDVLPLKPTKLTGAKARRDGNDKKRAQAVLPEAVDQVKGFVSGQYRGAIPGARFGTHELCDVPADQVVSKTDCQRSSVSIAGVMPGAIAKETPTLRRP